MAKALCLVVVLLLASLVTVEPSGFLPPPPLIASPPPPPPSSPPPTPPTPSTPPPPRCPPCSFPFLQVRPLKVSCDHGIDATIIVRYVDKVLKQVGPYQLPPKGKEKALTQQIRVTKVESFSVDFIIKRGSTKVYLSATVTLWLAKKVAVPTGKKTRCGDPVYCIELRLVIRPCKGGKQYEVYSGNTLVAKKKYELEVLQ